MTTWIPAAILVTQGAARPSNAHPIAEGKRPRHQSQGGLCGPNDSPSAWVDEVRCL